MSKDAATYLQFPICLLAFGTTERERLTAILAHGLWHLGVSCAEGRAAAEMQERIEAEYPLEQWPTGLPKRWSLDQAVMMLGRQRFIVRGGSMPDDLDRVQVVRQFVQQQTTRHGSQPFVRIRSDAFWNAFQDGTMPYRSFAVLCAVYCGIGARKKMVLTQDRIRAMALGYKSPTPLAADPDFVKACREPGKLRATRTPGQEPLLPLRTDKAQPLSAFQLRATLNDLEGAGWFARVSDGRRHWFSHHVNRDALVEMIKTRLKHRNAASTNRRADQEALRAVKHPPGYDSAQSYDSAHPPKKTSAGLHQDCTDHHRITTGELHTVIEALSIEPPSIKSPHIPFLVGGNGNEDPKDGDGTLSAEAGYRPFEQMRKAIA